MTAPAPSPVRLGWLDGLRGVAILLMYLDHVLAVGALGLGDGMAVRLTLTRASLPLFMLCAGFLLAARRGPSRWRWAQVVGAAALSTVLVGPLDGMASLDILAVYVMALVCWRFIPIRRAPLLWCAPFLVAGFYWQPALGLLGLSWDGYALPWVLGLMAWGAALVHGDGGRSAVLLAAAGERVPRWVRWLGARPLGAYLWHLPVLYVVAG